MLSQLDTHEKILDLLLTLYTKKEKTQTFRLKPKCETVK